MAVRLGKQALGGVDKNDRQVRRGSARGHVACVLFVARRVRNNEFAAGGAEVAVGNVNGDTLLALSAQTIGQQGEIERAAGAVDFAPLHRGDVIFINGLRIMQQAADQRGLAVVHAAGSGKAQQIFAQVALKKCRKAFRPFRSSKRQHQK